MGNDFAPILTKTKFVQLYREGEFGNRSPTWDSFSAWENDVSRLKIGMGDLFHLRNRVAGGLTVYNVTAWDMIHGEYGELIYKGVKDSDIYISEMCPTHLTQIQGEVLRRPSGLYLYYSQVKKPMRDSLREGGKEALGLKAKMLLEYYLDTNSYEWLNMLLDRYQDHVVEFTTLSKCWGEVPGYNTLFWECRKY